MTEIFLTPPIAFVIYLVVVLAINGAGRILAGPERPTEAKSSLYAGGESIPTTPAAPGYRPFFVIALFFAILHLGVLMLASGGLTLMSGVYLVGLFVALLALILG
jgi:NADH:ubiquinone oxidoreductase subunit 3 (subunit A)